MKKKLLQHTNKVLGFAIFGLVGGLTGCLVKYGCPPDDMEVLYGPAPYDTVVCEYGVEPMYGVMLPAADDSTNGEWQLTKETMTNGDGFGGVYTREDADLLEIVIYDFTLNDVSRTVIPNYSSEAASYVAPSSYKYNVKQQANGTWLLTIDGLFDTEPNLDGGRSPITIHKITKNSLEWEYESYGGDEGPVGYYQYFKRSISIAN